MNMNKLVVILICLFGLNIHSEAKIKVLIIDGQNNHAVWPKSTIMMRQYLEETGLFSVSVYRSKYTWRGERESAFLELAGVGKTQD